MLSTFEHRCFELADIELIFTPQTDLAILNYIAHHIIEHGACEQAISSTSTRRSSCGNTDIGYGLRPEHPLQKAREERGRLPAAPSR